MLDCFKQGGYDFPLADLLPTLHALNKEIRDDYGVVGYDNLPNLENEDTDLHQVITDGCRGFARKVEAMRWADTMILGSPTYDKESKKITKVKAYQHIFGLAGRNEVAKRLKISVELADEILKKWKQEVLLNEVSDTKDTYKKIKADVLTNDMLSNALKDASAANSFATLSGVFIMAVFIVVSLSKYKCCSIIRRDKGCKLSSWTQSLLGLAGLILVILASLAAFGFSATLKISFNATSLQVLPFLALGLGVDDMFLLLHTFDHIDRYQKMAIRNREAIKRRSLLWRRKEPKYVIGEMLSRAGPSVSMTSFSNFFAFLMGGLIPLPAVQTFCYQSAIVVAFNYVVIVFCLTPILAMYELYRNDDVEMISDDSPDDAENMIKEFIRTKYSRYTTLPQIGASSLYFCSVTNSFFATSIYSAIYFKTKG